MTLDRPIFVVGTMRSGSTLFRLVLDAHPNISICEETGFMGGLTAAKEIPNWARGRNWFERLGFTEEEFDARLREFYAGMFERYARSQGKSRWGEKTPFHSRYIAQMAALFPDAVFVAIVRHPGAVVHSLVEKFHYETSDAVTYWESTNKEILRRGLELADDRFALLRYEDLVAHPEETLHELVEFLDEPWSEDLLRHNDVQAARGTPRISAGATRTRDPITTDRAHRWSDSMTEDTRRLLESSAGPLARFLGYLPTEPGAPGALVPPNPEGRRRLLTRAGLAERQAGEGAVSVAEDTAAVIMPDMSPAELAKRLQAAEAALARIRSSRAVRWTNAARRAQRRATGVPIELFGAASGAVRNRTAQRRKPQPRD
ncbi:Sulfotransferase family protein [Blastococcus sp. DSM 46786]|uniref:sulfotransferase family protein n=1 Tax=Blastococcus sp. DSM 46786 TaxID=1798227 RepID=UPI0008CA0774|nr:sulfotransferase [Blastococcus sp. DSM 46786]SEK38184.1 Sulfotransferase family protein [Blastococcus sp. DSM 46786]